MKERHSLSSDNQTTNPTSTTNVPPTSQTNVTPTKKERNGEAHHANAHVMRVMATQSPPERMPPLPQKTTSGNNTIVDEVSTYEIKNKDRKEQAIQHAKEHTKQQVQEHAKQQAQEHTKQQAQKLIKEGLSLHPIREMA